MSDIERILPDNIYLVENETNAIEVLNYCLKNWHMSETGDLFELKDGKLSFNSNTEDYKSSIRILANMLGYSIADGMLVKDGSLQLCTVAIELFYVDREYRDSYYLYYSRKHFDYERFALRALIFEGDARQALLDYDRDKLNPVFVGSCVFRPLAIGTIGRALIAPRYLLKETAENEYYIRTSRYTVSPFGVPLTVDAFPFMMQDSETVTCAEVTLINMLDYFSAQYNDYRFTLPSDIKDISAKYSYERILPSKGLNYEMLTKILLEQGFHPKMYMAKQSQPTWDIKRTLHRYIESGIPVAVELATGRNNALHSVVCIGYGTPKESEHRLTMPHNKRIYSLIDENRSYKLHFLDTADECEEYIVMDDNKTPYRKAIISEQRKVVDRSHQIRKSVYCMDEDEILGFTVPLHARMIMEASSAETICLTLLAQEETNFESRCDSTRIGEDAARLYQLGGSFSAPLITRLFLASASTYRKERVKATSSGLLKDQYAMLPLPHFVWVCELYSLQSFANHEIIGEIVLDGTAAPNTTNDSLLLLHYPYRFGVRYPEEGIDALLDKFAEILDDWRPIKAFSGNLFLLGERG